MERLTDGSLPARSYVGYILELGSNNPKEKKEGKKAREGTRGKTKQAFGFS